MKYLLPSAILNTLVAKATGNKSEILMGINGLFSEAFNCARRGAHDEAQNNPASFGLWL